MPTAIATALARLADTRASAILRTPLGHAAQPALDAAIEGGFRVVEITLTTPGALTVLAKTARSPDLLVGAGTVLDLAAARAAVDAGARFLVSPIGDPELIGWCREHDVLCIPGTYTPTEMWAAHRAGAEVVKLFPGPADGPTYVRACLGPFPQLRIFPTSGVTLANAAEFLAAGAFGVGFVNTLFVPDDLAAGRFAAIAERARSMVAAVTAAPRR
jgi:Entner-Doudoroff aldolase